jgi:hypothetical protein
METAGSKAKKQAAGIEPQPDTKVFRFNSQLAKGRIRCTQETYGLRISCDGKPLLFIDLYYKSEDGQRHDPPHRDRVHVQMEAPVPGEASCDDSWMDLYIGKAGITQRRGSAGNFADRTMSGVLHGTILFGAEREPKNE